MYEVNEIVKKFLLAGDKFRAEMHLGQSGLTNSVCGPFKKIKERIQKLKEKKYLRNIYQNHLDKVCFQRDMAYGDFKDLTRTVFDKILRDKAFNIGKNSKCNGYWKGITSMIYNFFDKKTLVVVLKMQKGLIKNYQTNKPNQLLENLIKEKYTHFL